MRVNCKICIILSSFSSSQSIYCYVFKQRGRERSLYEWTFDGTHEKMVPALFGSNFQVLAVLYKWNRRIFIANGFSLSFFKIVMSPPHSIGRFHMTSRRPYWCSKTMKRRPCCMVYQENPLGVELFSHVNVFFCSNESAEMLTTWLKTLFKADTSLRWAQGLSRRCPS